MNRTSFISLFLLVFCLLFSAGCGGPEKRRPKIKWEEARLDDLRTVTLLFRGKAQGNFKAVFLESDGLNSDLGEIAFSAASARPISQEIKACTLSLQKPCSALVNVQVEEMGTENKSELFALDPSSHLYELFKPIDKLPDKSCERIIKGINRLRISYMDVAENKSWFLAQLEGRKALMSLLEKENLSRQYLLELKSTIPHLAKGNFQKRFELAKKLRTLRFFEALIASPLGLKPPWGTINKTLGFHFVPRNDLAISSGWSWLARLRIAKRLPQPHRPKYLVDMWQPLATQKLLKLSSNQRIRNTLHFAVKTFSTPLDELTAPQDFYVSNKTYVLDSKGARTGRWPPRRARVDLLVRTFVREAVLKVSVNGSKTMEVVNGAHLEVDEAVYNERQTTQVSVPINPLHLRAYENEVRLELSQMRFEGEPFPMRLAEIGISVSNKEEDK